MAKYAFGPATIEGVISKVETLSLAQAPFDRQTRPGGSFFRFRDHGFAHVYACYQSLAPDQMRQCHHVFAGAAAYVQDAMTYLRIEKVEHLTFASLDRIQLTRFIQ